MSTIKGILNFPTLFTPKAAKGSTDKKFGVGVLLQANDPQVAPLLAEVAASKLDGCPSGYTGTDCCFDLYENKIPPSKAYHDPRFIGWYLFTCTSKEADRPSVVDMSRMPIVDPGAVYGGMVGYVSAGISYYPKGTGGIGGWLNGVLLTDEEPPMGRLDNRPSVEQMFANVPGGTAPQQMAPPQQAAPIPPAPGYQGVIAAHELPKTAPVPPTPPAAPQAPVAPVALVMTAKAAGVTYEQYMATPGWTDELLIAQGLAIKPSFA